MYVNNIDKIKDKQNQVLLHILTKKGKGIVSLNMNKREYHDDAEKFHAVKPNGKVKPSEKIEKKINSEKPVPSFQDVFGKLSCEIARNRDDTVCITAAMREWTGLVPYSKEFPDSY